MGYLWVNDPATELISSLSEGGQLGDMVIPTAGLETMSGSGIRQVAEADGRLFPLDGDHPWGTNLNVFDPDSGEFEALVSLTFGLLDLIEFDGYLWVTSSSDHLLIRIDLTSGDQRRYPLPGKPGGLVVVDDALWVTLYQPGALIRLDTNADLIESARSWPTTGIDSHIGCCAPARATPVAPPSSSSRRTGSTTGRGRSSRQSCPMRDIVCVNGYVEGETTPDQQAADLEEALTEAAIRGPYLLVAAADGVHSALRGRERRCGRE